MIPLDAKIYEVLALAMRYFFTAMGVLIVLRAFSWLRKDRKIKHQRIEQLSNAGIIGNFIIQIPESSASYNHHPFVAYEGTLGSHRSCDCHVPAEGIAAVHADYFFTDREGLYVVPRHGCAILIDGECITSRRQAMAHPMVQYSTLEIGDAVLQLRVLDSLQLPSRHPAPYSPYEPDFYDRFGSPAPGPYLPPDGERPWQQEMPWPREEEQIPRYIPQGYQPPMPGMPPYPPANPPVQPPCPPLYEPQYEPRRRTDLPPYTAPMPPEYTEHSPQRTMQPPYAPPLEIPQPDMPFRPNRPSQPYDPYLPPVNNPWQGGDGDAQ